MPKVRSGRVAGTRRRASISRTGKTFAANLPSGGFITDYAYDWHRHVVPPKQVEQANPLQFMLLDATEQAIADAGYDQRPLDRSRVGVVVGAMFGDEFSQQLNLALRLPEFQRTLRSRCCSNAAIRPATSSSWPSGLKSCCSNACRPWSTRPAASRAARSASRITKSFDFFGGGLALDAGEAAGLAALTASADFLLNGTCDVAVCAAGDRNLGGMIYEAEALSGRLAQEVSHGRLSTRRPRAACRAREWACCCSNGCPTPVAMAIRSAAFCEALGPLPGKTYIKRHAWRCAGAARDGHLEPGQTWPARNGQPRVGDAVETRHAAAIVEIVRLGQPRRAAASWVRWSVRSAIPRRPPARRL